MKRLGFKQVMFGKQVRRSGRMAKVVVVSFAIALGILGAELMARWILASEEERARGAHDLFSRDRNAATPRDTKTCSWADSLIAHPYLAYVHHRRAPCGLETANNVGMTSPYEVPLERDPDFFTILLEGGSVAQQLGSYPWLERALESRYALPPGRRFRVINAAMGATTSPRHPIVTVLYGHVVDAVVVVDGFNEVSIANPKRGMLLGAPNSLYLLQIKNPATSRLTARVELSRLLGEQLASIPILSHSFLWYFAVQAARGTVLDETTGTIRSADLAQDSYLESFSAPRSWTVEQRYSWHKQRYLEGIRLNEATAEVLRARFVHFLQPVPNLFKALTPSEREGIWRDFPSEYYLSLEASLADLTREGVSTLSLLRIFELTDAELYADMVHCRMEGSSSPGYEIMAQAIAERVGPLWGLTPL